MLDEAFWTAARRLIAADSVTDRGNLAAVAVVEEYCREAGLATTRLPSPDSADRDANLLAGPGGGANASGAPLLLVTHLDTVDPGPGERWRTDPFQLHIEGDRAYGLGVADVKLDALCKLFAARRLRGEKLARPFWFLGTYGEEAGLRGARQFARTAPFRPAFVMCGEPCENRIHHAHKGYAMVRATLRADAARMPSATEAPRVFTGKAAHSSTPHLGVNAIELALETIASEAPRGIVSIDGGSGPNTIPAECRVSYGASTGGLEPLVPAALRLRQAWRESLAAASPSRDERFDPAEAVGSITLARTRGAELELTLDGRLLPAHDADAVLADFGRRLEAAGLGAVRFEALRNSAGMDVAEDAEIVQRTGRVLKRFGLNPVPRAKPTSTEGGVFTRMGAEAIVFGPSPSKGNAHTPNEFAKIDEVAQAVEIYEALIREFCSNP